MLEVKNVGFHYGGGPWVLKDVSLKVADGERIAILGPSGYGKSTLAKLMAGYERPAEGAVLWNGASLPRRGYCPVQLIYQHPERALNPRWKMRQSLFEAGALDEDVLREVGIRPLWYDRWPIELSGGELQRFCVARVMRSETRVLIADEMTTMLDALSQAHIWNFVLNYADRNGMAVVAITHNRALAERVADRIIHIPELNHVQVDRSSL